MKIVLWILLILFLTAISFALMNAVWNSNLPDWFKLWFIIQSAR